MEMGAADHLVGISNYDPQTPELSSFPRVGDYHVIDWEKLSQIRPAALVIQRPKQEMAPVFKQRADALGIELVDIHMDRLDEIYPVIEKLGQAIGESQKAQALIANMRRQLAGVQAQAAGKPKVRTLAGTGPYRQFRGRPPQLPRRHPHDRRRDKRGRHRREGLPADRPREAPPAQPRCDHPLPAPSSAAGR